MLACDTHFRIIGDNLLPYMQIATTLKLISQHEPNHEQYICAITSYTRTAPQQVCHLPMQCRGPRDGNIRNNSIVCPAHTHLDMMYNGSCKLVSYEMPLMASITCRKKKTIKGL